MYLDVPSGHISPSPGSCTACKNQKELLETAVIFAVNS